MKNTILLLAIIILFAVTVGAQRTSPPSKEELAQITERGRNLAEYDLAAWHGSDAVMALNPTEGSVTRYIAKKDGDEWTVAFGRFNVTKDKFLIAYEAVQTTSPKDFTGRKLETPTADTDFFLHAARAIEVALADFEGEGRPYNIAVLPTKSKQWYVYLVPAQTKDGIYPLGADARYLVAEDGSKIVEKRQLHRAIIEFSQPQQVKSVAAGYHTAILDDIPEDTDVFHVLVRKPSVPEWIATRQYAYKIEADGTIVYLMPTKKFLEKK